MQDISGVPYGLEHRNIHNLPQPDYSTPARRAGMSRQAGERLVRPEGLCEHQHPTLRTRCAMPAGHEGLWCKSGPQEDPKAVAWPRPLTVRLKSIKGQQMSRPERRSMAKGGRGKLVKRSKKS